MAQTRRMHLLKGTCPYLYPPLNLNQSQTFISVCSKDTCAHFWSISGFLKFERESLEFLPWVQLFAVSGWLIKGVLGFRARYPFHALQLSSHMIKLFINPLVLYLDSGSL